LGLTGGIGSGKSSVASILSDLGATVIDADAISRACTAPMGSAIEMIRSTFGDDLVNTDGGLDRNQMRKLVFSNPQAKSQLEAIVHPRVGIEISRQSAAAQLSGARCLVFDIPLLVESAHWRKQLDRILIIDCAKATQIERVHLRNGMPKQEVEKILSTQATRLQRAACADFVLVNDSIDLPQLRSAVQKIAHRFGL
jgi:dephospho-CoA kinase